MDPLAPLVIDPGYLSDPAGDDLRVLVEGLKRGREIARAQPFDDLRGDEVAPGADATSDDEIAACVRRSAQSYYHPVGTCRMGTGDAAVVDRSSGSTALRGYAWSTRP